MRVLGGTNAKVSLRRRVAVKADDGYPGSSWLTVAVGVPVVFETSSGTDNPIMAAQHDQAFGRILYPAGATEPTQDDQFVLNGRVLQLDSIRPVYHGKRSRLSHWEIDWSEVVGTDDSALVVG